MTSEAKADTGVKVESGEAAAAVLGGGGESHAADWQAMDSAQPKYVFDGSRYWLQDTGGRWIYLNGEQFKRHLRGLGLHVKPEGSETLSEVEAAMNLAEVEYRVEWAGALAGWPAGFRWMCGNYVLVTRSPELVPVVEPPEDAPRLEEADAFGDSRGWPVLGRVVRGLLSCKEVGDAQLWRYFGYVQHTLRCLYQQKWDRAPTLAVAGEVECGKSLLFVSVHRALFGKREAQPYEWMVGRDNFNGEMLEAVLLTIDDEVSDTNPVSRARLGDRLKKMAAGEMQRIRGLHKDAVALQPLWRPVILVNEEPQNLMVLPPIEEDNADKIILLKAYRKEMPMPVATTEDRQLFWRTLEAELPHFVWWLLHEFRLPAEMQGRFGVRAYHHPAVLSALSELSSEMTIWHYVDRVIFGYAFHWPDPLNGGTMERRGEWMGTVEELYGLLTDTSRGEDSSRQKLSVEEARTVPKPGWLGRRLKKLQALYPEQVKYKQTTKRRLWHLIPSDGDDESESQEEAF